MTDDTDAVVRLGLEAVDEMGLTQQEAADVLQPFIDEFIELWETLRPVRRAMATWYLYEWMARPWRLDLLRGWWVSWKGSRGSLTEA